MKLELLLILIISLTLSIPAFAYHPDSIICEDKSCIESCLLDPNCELGPNLILPKITKIQSDKSNYYIGDNIIITGTIIDVDWNFDTIITYDILDYNNKILGTGQSNSLQQDGNFSFTIYWSERELWGNYSGDVLLSVKMQESNGGYSFYYSDKPNMTNEANYDKLMNHNSTLIIHDNILSSYNNTMNNQNYMIDMHDGMFNNQTEIITFQQEQIISLQSKTTDQQLQIIQLESQMIESLTQLKLVGGYLVSANVTLGEEFPAILNAKDNKKIDTEIQRLEDTIIRSEIKIADTRTSLDEALLAGNPNKINKFTNSMGSQLLSSEILKSQLKMIYFYLDVYPQE